MGAGVHGGFGNTYGSFTFGSTDYMKPNDNFSVFIKKRKDVDANGFYDVIAHGNENSIEVQNILPAEEEQKMKCEKCGAETREYREGHSRGWICDVCGWGCATSFYEPYETDTTQYEIVISGNESSTKMIKTMAEIAGVNFLKAKQLLEMTEASVFKGKAIDIIEIKKKLDDEGVLFKISPEFPY